MFSMRFGMSELRKRALAAVDEVAERANEVEAGMEATVRFSVRLVGGLAGKSHSKANVEDALKLADLMMASRRPGQSVRLEDHETGTVYRDDEILELRRLIDNT